MKILVHDFLRDTAQRMPDHIALWDGDRSITFGELYDQSGRIAAALIEGGLKRGDRVVVMLETSIELVACIFGVFEAGGVLVLVGPGTKEKKLAYILEDSGAAIFVGPGSKWSVRQMIANPRPRPVDPGLIDNDLCTIVYTSGSTGNPKGVMLTHRNMANTAWAISTYLGNVPEDVVLCVLPLSFDYGLYQVITGARVGFTVVSERSFAYPYQTLLRIQQRRVTGLPGVPTIFSTFLGMAPYEGLDLGSLRYFTNTGAAFPPAHIRRLRALFPNARIFSMYGLTECTRVSYLDPSRLEDKIESVGKAMPNEELYIVDSEGHRVGPNVIGELVSRGANVMRGYWNKPAETAAKLRDGEILGEKVLYTGDLFRADEDGFLYFVGRTDDIFKCRGEKVSPKEIEAVLYAMEEIAEAAVVPVDDPLDGQAIRAVVVARAGTALTEQKIRAHCRANLEPRLLPKFVEIKDSLPKTDSGKIQRRNA